MAKKAVWFILGTATGVVLWYLGVLLWGIVIVALAIMVVAFVKAVRKPKEKTDEKTNDDE